MIGSTSTIDILQKLRRSSARVESPEEFHLQALPEPCVTRSGSASIPHTAVRQLIFRQSPIDAGGSVGYRLRPSLPSMIPGLPRRKLR
jgi:hypothetical protein